MKRRLLNIVFFIAAFCYFGNRGAAQELIDEDFLDNIDDNAKVLWTESIPAFANNAVPEKYKDESALIFGFKRSVTIDKKSRSGFLSKGERSLVFNETVRFKIRLNDRNAVRAFTAVYFRYSDKTDGFSAKITKPDGVVQLVSLNDAVGVESVSDVPEFYKSFFDQQSGGEKRYYKVAVSGLEPGDILEYVTITKSKLNVMYQGYIEFSPQYEICNKGYPILFNQITIETDDKSFFKSLSVNGAPEFKKEGASDAEFFRYVFTDTDRPVEKDVNFISSYKVYPLVKFQVIYANSDKIKGALIGGKGEIKKSFARDELARKAWEDYEQVGDQYHPRYGKIQNLIDAMWAELKKQGAKDWSEKDLIKNAYYKLRNIVVNSDSYLSDKVAAYIFGSLLYQRDIRSDLIITVSNNIGKLENVLFDQEIRYAVRVNNMIYFNCTDHTNPGELVEDLLGNEAYVIAQPQKNNTQEVKPITLPDADESVNIADYTINAELAADTSTLVVARTTSFKGVSKARNIAGALRFTPYMLEDYKHFNGLAPIFQMSSADQFEYNKSVKALREEFETAKTELVKSDLEQEFDQKVKLLDFKIKSDGRSIKNKDLVFTDNFELHGMLRKAGKNILITIPGLVGSQLQIKKEEQNRKYDINVGASRTLNWTINFKIPEGYTAEGMKELATVVDNETGLFSCSAEEQNGNVVIQIKKVYKQSNAPKEKWPDMVAFVTAAYNNSFKYILLKPKK